jgi:hypothetical protein
MGQKPPQLHTERHPIMHLLEVEVWQASDLLLKIQCASFWIELRLASSLNQLDRFGEQSALVNFDAHNDEISKQSRSALVARQ